MSQKDAKDWNNVTWENIENAKPIVFELGTALGLIARSKKEPVKCEFTVKATLKNGDIEMDVEEGGNIMLTSIVLPSALSEVIGGKLHPTAMQAATLHGVADMINDCARVKMGEPPLGEFAELNSMTINTKAIKDISSKLKEKGKEEKENCDGE